MFLEEDARGQYSDSGFLKNRKVKRFLVILLVVAIIVEGYYIYLLKDKIEKRDEEIKGHFSAAALSEK